MGVSVDRFLGYSVDVKDKLDALNKLGVDTDIWDGTFKKDAESNELSEKYNFVGYYNSRLYGGLNGRVTLIVDGMSGEYAKLMYVVARTCDEDEEDELVTSINKMLNGSGISEDISKQIVAVYNKMFNTEVNAGDIDIKAEYLLHWH